MRIVVSIIFMVAFSAWGRPLKESYWIIEKDRSKIKKFTETPNWVVDHVSRDGFELYGPSGLGAELKRRKVNFKTLASIPRSTASDYPTSADVIVELKKIKERFPKWVELIEIGKSIKGQPLVFVRLTAPEARFNRRSERPKFKYVANMHGDEIVGRELMVKLIRELAQSYGKVERITQILDKIQVYIMPSMNPDGADEQKRWNANGDDLNRKFPDWTTSDDENTISGRPIEVQAMMKFQREHEFKLSANFHGGAEVVNYPWDALRDPFPLDNLVKRLSLDYAKRAPYIYQSRNFKNGITNGADWYIVKGGMQDWSFYWHKDVQLTIELSKEKWPSYSTIDDYYQKNKESMLHYIEQTLEI